MNLVKSTVCNELHPKNNDFISVNKEESKLEKSTEIILSIFKSYTTLKYCSILSKGCLKYICMLPPSNRDNLSDAEYFLLWLLPMIKSISSSFLYSFLKPLI